MSWPKRSSGRRCDSSSGQYLIFGEILKGVIGMVIYSNSYQKFDAADKKVEEAEEHNYPKNFEGRSQSMESDAIIKMVENLFFHHYFIIVVIVSDDYSPM